MRCKRSSASRIFNVLRIRSCRDAEDALRLAPPEEIADPLNDLAGAGSPGQRFHRELPGASAAARSWAGPGCGAAAAGIIADRGQWLIQFVCQAGGHLPHEVEPADVGQVREALGQVFGTLAVRDVQGDADGPGDAAFAVAQRLRCGCGTTGRAIPVRAERFRRAGLAGAWRSAGRLGSVLWKYS